MIRAVNPAISVQDLPKRDDYTSDAAYDFAKREFLGDLCIHSRRVSAKMQRGVTLFANGETLERTCAYECGHHECRRISVTTTLEENYQRPVFTT